MELQLSDILTAGGAVAAAGLVTGLIAMLKNLPGIGTWLDANHEPLVAFVLSLALVIVASIDAGVNDLKGGFLSFLAWYGIATISMAIHDQASPPEPLGVNLGHPLPPTGAIGSH